VSNTFVHRLGLNESESVGDGTRIWAFAHVLKGAVIGTGCNIGESCFIESGAVIGNNVTVKNGVQVWGGVTLEDDVFVGPNATFTNDFNPRSTVKKGPADLWPTTVKKGATIGANATVIPGIVIREHAFIAAGSVVTRDVPPYALLMGNPARQRGWMCECGEKFTPGIRCTCGRLHETSADGIVRLADSTLMPA
jgi:acetyltransferase-like isoleucine patch superfamily enzyme